MVFMAKTLLSTLLIAVLLSIPAKSLADNVATQKLQIITKNSIHDFIVEIADNPQKQEHGLSERKNMEQNHGMLFLFDKNLFGKTNTVNMWMKNTYLPLDMIFIKSGGEIAKIVTATPLSLETIPSGEPVTAVLELNAGICKKLGIEKNDKVVMR